VTAGKLTGATLDMSDCPDIAPILALVCQMAEGESRLMGCGRLRLKECDRLAATVEVLNLLGGNARAEDDDIVIQGVKELKGGVSLPDYNDHRMVMLGMIAASIAQEPVVVRGVENPFLTSVLRSIEEAIRKTGYTMVIHQIGTQEDEVFEGASLVRSKRLCGLILLGGRFDYTPEQIATLGVPFVCCTFTNSFGSLQKSAYSSVYIDDYAEAYRAVRKLTDLGHKKIALLLGTTDDHSISELRFKGYCDALKDAGLSVDDDLIIETNSFNMDDAFKATEKFLEKNKEFTAIFSIADAMGIAAIKALHNKGIKIPEDCSIISIDGIQVSKYTIPTLTTLVQPSKDMGAKAVEILLDVLNGNKNSCQLKVETSLRKGGTLAKPIT
jgi:LacI family transcriptional regulator